MNKCILEYTIWRDKRKRMWYDPNFKLISCVIPDDMFVLPLTTKANQDMFKANKNRLIYGDSCQP